MRNLRSKSRAKSKPPKKSFSSLSGFLPKAILLDTIVWQDFSFEFPKSHPEIKRQRNDAPAVVHQWDALVGVVVQSTAGHQQRCTQPHCTVFDEDALHTPGDVHVQLHQVLRYAALKQEWNWNSAGSFGECCYAHQMQPELRTRFAAKAAPGSCNMPPHKHQIFGSGGGRRKGTLFQTRLKCSAIQDNKEENYFVSYLVEVDIVHEVQSWSNRLGEERIHHVLEQLRLWIGYCRPETKTKHFFHYTPSLVPWLDRHQAGAHFLLPVSKAWTAQVSRKKGVAEA